MKIRGSIVPEASTQSGHLAHILPVSAAWAPTEGEGRLLELLVKVWTSLSAGWESINNFLIPDGEP